MSKILSLKKGFTLIEILIVITIIAILAVLSAAGYTAFRKAALIDLSADSLVAQINEMRDKAIHGTKEGIDGEGEKFLKCYGVNFEKSADSENTGYKMIAVAYRFTNQKVWGAGKWEYEGCSDEKLEGELPLEMDSMVNIESVVLQVEDGTQTPFDGEFLTMRFAPPDGTADFLGIENPNGKALVKLRYGAGTDDRYTKIVGIDLKTGKVIKY
jgi:prepilin-type N-terminal cleavage/methylation domain-containing protein